jgi:hypothetical protein
MESHRAARAMLDVLLENRIFYISRMHEFLHRLGHFRQIDPLAMLSECPLRSDRYQIWGKR